MINWIKLVMWLLIGLSFIFAFIGVLILYYYFYGSFEMFPTEDDYSKVREVSLVILIGVVLIEFILFLIIKGLRKKKQKKLRFE